MPRSSLVLILCLAALALAVPAGAAERTTPEGAPVPELDWRAA
jgi:hypothetical protein